MSSLRPRIFLVRQNHGAVTGGSGANTTKMRSHQRQEDQNMSVLDSVIWDDVEFILTVEKAARRQKKNSKLKNNSVFQWSHISVGHKVRSSRLSAGKFPTSRHALDDVEKRPLLPTPACRRPGNHLQHQKSTTNRHQREQHLQKGHTQRCTGNSMHDIFFSKKSRQYSNSIQTEFKQYSNILFRTVQILFYSCFNTIFTVGKSGIFQALVCIIVGRMCISQIQRHHCW